ncbi:SENP1 [Acanthosepion pharaonis]|uniref:SENP1 n=1 Tax=Acanthosepion pharaonis TaxID=158019 RepID=A0A812BJI0_ACAPH|nr:SENP1 [Sepia pharaonis]
MLNSLSEKLVSYVSPSSNGGRADIDSVVEEVQSSVDYDNGGKHKRCEPIDVDASSPCVKRRRIEEGFVQKVTNSVAKMAEWLVHGTNYLFGRLDEPHLNLKEIVEEDEENGQRLDEMVDELEDAEDDYRFLNLPNSKLSSTHKSQHQENEYLHRPSIHDRSRLFDQENKQINGNATAIHFLYSSKSQNVPKSQLSIHNGGGSKYMLSPRVRVNCSNMKTVGLSGNKLYSIPCQPKVRNDVCNVVQKPHMHTAAQCVRLEEKERYRRLIQQFSRGNLTKQLAVKSEEKDFTSVTSKTSRSSPIGDEDAQSEELKMPRPTMKVRDLLMAKSITPPTLCFFCLYPACPLSVIFFFNFSLPSLSYFLPPSVSSLPPHYFASPVPTPLFSSPHPVSLFCLPTPVSLFCLPPPRVTLLSPPPRVTLFLPPRVTLLSPPVSSFVSPRVTLFVSPPRVTLCLPPCPLLSPPPPCHSFVSPHPRVLFCLPTPCHSFVSPTPVSLFCLPTPCHSFVSPTPVSLFFLPPTPVSLFCLPPPVSLFCLIIMPPMTFTFFLLGQSETEKSSENTNSKSSPKPCVRLKNNPYLAEDWVTQFVKKYSASTREQKRKIEEEQLKIKIFEEKRKSQEEKLNEEIQLRLQLSEKEPPILEEKEIESEEPPLLPEITSEMKSEIESALKPRPSDEVLVEGFRIQIKRQDMSTLSGLNWLNDEVINFYLSMLMKRSSKGKRPKVHSFNTFFYPKLQSSGYDGVRRWTRKVDIFAVKYLLIPVHLGMHWCLAVVNFTDKTICYYDSMGGKNLQCLDTIKKYLCEESLDKRKMPFNLAGWTTKLARDIPHQMNGSDCGMFACKYADYITREIPISFTQADMPQFRQLMVYEILKKKLLSPFFFLLPPPCDNSFKIESFLLLQPQMPFPIFPFAIWGPFLSCRRARQYSLVFSPFSYST